MANRKISQFTELTAPAVTDVLPIIDQPVAKSQRAVPQPNFRPTYSGKCGKDALASEKRTGFQCAIKHGAVNIATRCDRNNSVHPRWDLPG